MCYVRAYLRASTDERDASRAKDQLKAFAVERSL
jgi:DNA invertase Pin-like site-specific DNA recombinase